MIFRAKDVCPESNRVNEKTAMTFFSIQNEWNYFVINQDSKERQKP